LMSIDWHQIIQKGGMEDNKVSHQKKKRGDLAQKNGRQKAGIELNIETT